MFLTSCRTWWCGVTLLTAIPCTAGLAESIDAQPLKAQVRRVVQALEYLGSPLSQDQRQALETAYGETRESDGQKMLEEILDARVLVVVQINPESRVKVTRGQAPAILMENGWSTYLVKVVNEAGVTARLRVASPQSGAVQQPSSGEAEPRAEVGPADVKDRFLNLAMFDQQPLVDHLSGLGLEYRLLQLYSRDRGTREATLSFDVGQGTQDLGFRNGLPILFQCRPSTRVQLHVVDEDGTPTTARFEIRDEQGHVYPARSKRLEPDFFFHDQVYRADGESIGLPPGQYRVTFTRGPEYRVLHRTIEVLDQPEQELTFRLKRWIHLAERGWYSGDHHIHAAGCSHYEAPTQGVGPESMMRHIVGEDLNVGCVLAWGPCWYHQKQFFAGGVHPFSTPRYLMRYDVEVSGFPSSHAGHLCLLGLAEDDYPGTSRIEEWPSWDLPVLQWAKGQGAVVGFAHSGWGLATPDDAVPSYHLPAFDGIGANEYIVDVVHNACDFISAVDTPAAWELSIWYHTLNCGFTTRISGETDFPCIYDERVGLGRAYVQGPPGKQLDYADWLQGIRDGRSYCCDGMSHLIDFQVQGIGVGVRDAAGGCSQVRIPTSEPLKVTVTVAARLPAQPPADDLRSRKLDEQPYWHLERARMGSTRNVAVELIANGQSVDRREIPADGTPRPLTFEYTPPRSCWLAVRILPSSHTNPIFVEIDGQPIRASRRSAQWCLDAVDRCWSAKQGQIRVGERQSAQAAYDTARAAYAKILQESFDDRPPEKSASPVPQ